MAAASQKVLLSVRSLCKDFRRPTGTLFPVLEGINLDIFDGEFLAIVGTSGSGKSTLLRLMAGLLKPDRGKVSYAQTDKSNEQLISFVFQNFALFPWLTVRENVEISVRNTPKEERARLVDHMLELVGLVGFEDVYPRELSGGMKQRVSLSRAMVCEPVLMFMDEPFSALDPLTAQSLRAELGRLWTQADRKIRSIVLVTHSLDEAVQLADRIIILSAAPGTIFKSIEVNLPRPRNPNSIEYQKLEEFVEKTFGELYLNKITAEHEEDTSALETAGAAQQNTGSVPKDKLAPTKRIKPLINTSLVLVEGLLTRLGEETEGLDLYDLADDMGQGVDQMLPAVASAEMLELLYTPGTLLVLTERGRAFASEQDPLKRRAILREACLNLPLMASLYEVVRSRHDEGLEKSIALEQIVMMLPFEDPDLQFDALLKWGRHVNLLSYDAAKDILCTED